MRGRTTFRGLWVSGGLVALVGAKAALGQGAPAGADLAASTDLNEVVVTARRVEERLQDVPISITVFTQKDLEDHNFVNAQDLAAYTPSLSANSAFGPANSSFAIRGFVQNIGTEPTVGVFFDDVTAARGTTQGIQAGDGAGPGYFYDLQNVQVLKGPQGTLFGRNTSGGTILLVSQKPTANLEGYLEGSYGNYDMWRAQGALNIPLASFARFRVAFDHQSRDGYLHNDSGIGPGAFDDVDYSAVRASLDLDLSNNIENYTVASYSHSATNGDLAKVEACNPTPSRANFLGQLTCAQLAAERGADFYTVENTLPNPASVVTQWQVINTTTYKPADAVTIKNIASYAQYRDFDASALYGTNWKVGGVALPFVDILPISGTYSADQSTTTEEFQIQGDSLDHRLTYQGGAYFEFVRPLRQIGNENPQFASCTNLAALDCTPLLPGQAAVNYTAGETHYRDIGLYTQESYSLTDQVKLTGGLRYTWDKVNNISDRITHAITAPNKATTVCTDAVTTTLPTCAEYLEERSHAPTWLIDVDYKPIEDVLIYGKWARGYRAGGLLPNSPATYRAYAAETVDDYEVGAKTSWGGDLKGTFDVDAFYNDLTNQQLAVGFNAAPGHAVAPTSGVVNAGKSRMFGVEANASLSPLRGVTLVAGYAYLNATIRSVAPIVSTDPNYTVNNQLIPGQTLPLSPRHKLTTTATYALPIDERVGQMALSATLSYTSNQRTQYVFNNAALVAAYGYNYDILPSTSLLDLNFDWKSIFSTPLDLSLFATNVTAKQYYVYNPALAASGFEPGVVGLPRMYGGRLRYRF